MITRKLNPRVYDSLRVLLDAVHFYRVYRRLDTLPLYLYYELLILLLTIKFPVKRYHWRNQPTKLEVKKNHPDQKFLYSGRHFFTC